MDASDHREIIKRACIGYLALLHNAPAEERERQLKLAQVFDDLCAAYNYTDDVGPDTDGIDAPRSDASQFVEMASRSFPELGYYRLADPLEGLKQKIGVGDARDDLSDIAVDLTEVMWLLDQPARTGDAIWQFRWGYENHWGQHLHDLRWYLHRLLYWG